MAASHLSTLYSRLSLSLSAARQLGPSPVALYALYRFGLWTGHYRRLTPVDRLPEVPSPPDSPNPFRIAPVLRLPDRADLAGILGEQAREAIAEADEIARGQVRLYSGPPVPLELGYPGNPDSPQHWTTFERGKNPWLDGRDIKDIWEPARFGWVFPLARAFTLTQNTGYAQVFWQNAETFLRANPPNLGPQWASGQEVALRLIALVFAAQVFSADPAATPDRLDWLGRSVAAHTRRIPPTLVYARSQNNNHLVTEAAGLFTAGLALPDHPQAASWRELGWTWLNRALQNQIAPDGTYTQHSVNYHRLMLHAALWVHGLLRCRGESYPPATSDRLAAATGWLAGQLDPLTGQVPNLGSNDGAHILPLASGGFADYRPVLQAASRAFLGGPCLPPGPWDELGVWLGEVRMESGESAIGQLGNWAIRSQSPIAQLPGRQIPPLHARLSTPNTWATLRAVRFSGRPAHADQLHVDLWWRGLNLALDAGTYRYNAPAPWNNSLARTLVHNTVEVDGQDQMRRAGRFLWLDWAQAEVTSRESSPDGAWEKVTARHSGYARLGVIHERTLERRGDVEWLVTDRLLPVQGSSGSKTPHTARLNWLLPDWPWELDGTAIVVTSPLGRIRLGVQVTTGSLADSPLSGLRPDELLVQLVRAGERLAGTGAVDPIQGWYSPTYSVRLPALAFTVQVTHPLQIQFLTTWMLPN